MAIVSAAIISLATGAVLNMVVIDSDPEKPLATPPPGTMLVFLTQPVEQTYRLALPYGFLSPTKLRLFNANQGSLSEKSLPAVRAILQADINQTRADLIQRFTGVITAGQMTNYQAALNAQRDILLAEVSALVSFDDALAYQQHGWPAPAGGFP